MTSDCWERIKQIFQAALERSPEERPDFVFKACQGEANLRAEVEKLLQALDRAGDFLEKPVFGNLASRSGSPKPTVFAAGEVVSGRFEVIGFLGQGGMGEVYEARDLELGERLALKAIRPEISSDQRIITRFKHEVQLARRVAHHNVCRVFDFGRHLRASSETDGAATAINFLTMELLRGETLAKHLDRIGCMATDEALPVIQQMVEALAAAHKVGVIHRDFKPSNVILVPTASNDDLRASKMRAVVTDFGLARSAPVGELSALETAQSSLTDTGQLMGTISYMSPEQLEGGEISPATDIYALGLIIYEMVTGHRPFPDETPFAVAFRRLKEAPPSPRVHAPELDPRWEAAILHCLAIDPTVRFQSAHQVSQALCSKVSAASMSPQLPCQSSALVPQVQSLESKLEDR